MLQSSEHMAGLFIIKLGGSVITAKSENKFEVREDTLARIAREIKRARDESPFSLIVIHGAGPFGHTNVVKYDINNGVFTPRHKEGLEKTIKDCNFLDSKVVANLNEAGVPAVGLDPNKLAVQENKKVVSFDLQRVEQTLYQGKTPVLYGQMVPDNKLNASVISGDTILALLSKNLKPKKVLIGTDVGGVFTADPKKEPKAERIPKITEENFEEVLEMVGEAKTVDVTGGMRGKLLKLKEQLASAPAFIFDANEEGSFYKALLGKEVHGTEIVL